MPSKPIALVNKCSYNGNMIATEQIAQIVTDELEKLKDEKHWGEVVFRIPLRNGDPQQLNVVFEKTFRQPANMAQTERAMR